MVCADQDGAAHRQSMTAIDTNLAADVAPVGMTKNGRLILERDDRPYARNPWEAEPQPGRPRKSINRREITARVDEAGKVLSVTETVSDRFDGQSTTGKHFVRWQTRTITVIRTHAGGKQTNYFRAIKRRQADTRACTGRYKDSYRRLLSPEADARTLEGMADQLLGPAPAFDDLYPLAEVYSLDHNWHAPFLRAFLRAQTPAELTRNLFGKSRYRKDLVKAVASTTSTGLFIAWSMRGLVPGDWLVGLMRRCEREELSLADRVRREMVMRREVRPHLRGLDRASLRRLARTAHEAMPRLINDLSRMRVAPPRRVRSWTELHDHTAAADRNARYLMPTPQLPKLSKERAKTIQAEREVLSGTTTDGLTVIAADAGDMLLTWGQQMGNCIAGYQREMHTGRSHLLGVYEGKKLIANIEVRPEVGSMTLGQLLGRFNRPLPRAQHDDVVAFLAQAGVSTKGEYWGRVA